MKTARNVAIILGLAALVTFAPGGATASNTVSNVISVLFFGGLAFFGYRMYMENRVALFDLPEQTRVMLYGSATLLVFAFIATQRMWDESGPYILIWFALIGAAVMGLVTVVRQWREY